MGGIYEIDGVRPFIDASSFVQASRDRAVKRVGIDLLNDRVFLIMDVFAPYNCTDHHGVFLFRAYRFWKSLDASTASVRVLEDRK